MKLNTCSPPNNQGSPACSKLMVNNPETPVSTSASQSPTPSSRKDANQQGLDFNNKGKLIKKNINSLTIRLPNFFKYNFLICPHSLKNNLPKGSG